MTDLTDKWKAGTLEAGAYYILLSTGEIFPDLYNPYGYFEQFDSLVEKVLTPVPSYEEWKKAYECVVSENEEITRPVNYESMIGCVGWFSDSLDDKKAYLGILKEVSENGFKFKGELYDWWYSYFTPAKKSELKFWGE